MKSSTTTAKKQGAQHPTLQTIMKNKTNDQMFKSFMKDLHPLEMVILRERIAMIMDVTVNSIHDSPEQWANPFISTDTYISLADKFNKHLGFNQ